MYELVAARSDGVPLYVEEVTKDLLEAGDMPDAPIARASGGASAASSVPSALQDALMARLDRLSSAKEVGADRGCDRAAILVSLISKVSRFSDTCAAVRLGSVG